MSAVPGSWIGRMAAMLCCLLALFSAATASASVVDRLQHHPGAPVEHSHMLLSDLSMVEDHNDDGDGGLPDDQAGHHHHGESGTGLPVLNPNNRAFPGQVSAQPALSPASFSPGESVAGPERPPKPAGLIAT